jgi:hypothetical protein
MANCCVLASASCAFIVNLSNFIVSPQVENPKSEYRNSKQILNFNVSNSKLTDGFAIDV